MSGRVTRTRVTALVLAAGRSSRMGASNKLLAEVGGEPMVARVVGRLLQAPIESVLVVTGHDADAVEERIPPSALVVRNPDHSEGIGSSVRVGIGALGASVDAVVICLGDMPTVSTDTIRRLVEAFRMDTEGGAYVPIHGGRRGNPVLWVAEFFPRLLRLGGDTGARVLLSAHAEAVREVVVDDPGVLADVDTPLDLREIDSD